jgi:outer membrane biosynthesis protein TonB
MLVLFRKDEILYVKCSINLKRPVRCHEKVFEVGNHVDLLLPEEVIQILTENGNIRLWNGKKFIKLNLGQFNDVMVGKLFKVELYVEPKKVEEVKPQPVVKEEPEIVEEEKVEEVKPQPVVKEEPEIVEEEKVEEHKEVNENKKKRHKQNQGGDK